MGRLNAVLLLAGVLSLGAWDHSAVAAGPLWHRSVTIDVVVHPDGTSDSVETWAVRADTVSVAHSVAQQSFSWVSDLETVVLLDAATVKAGGEHIQAGPEALMNQAVTTAAYAPQFSATEARTILFPAVGAGDSVRYTLRRHGTATLFPGQFTTTLQPGTVAYLDAADITLTIPPGMSLRTEARGLNEAAPLLLPDAGLLRRWHLDPAAGGPVVLDASSFDNYAALGRAYAERAAPKSRPGPAVTALAARLTEGVPDQRAEALRLYRHVATEIRYVATFLGEGRVVPRDADTVLATGFGDCKDHAALLQALLAARGIAAVPALISLRSLYTLPAAPGLGALNHVITYVPSLDLYLDSTAPYAPFGLLPASEYDKPVVLARVDEAQLARTPALPPQPLELQTITEAKLGRDDVVSGTTTTRASGPQGIALRSMAAWIEGRGSAGAAAVQLRQLGTPGTGGFSFAPPEGDADAYQVKGKFVLDEALIDGGEAPFALPGGLGMFERPGRQLLAGPAEDGGHICYPGREVEEVTLALPPGASVASLPHDVSVSDGGAVYESRYTATEGVLHARREFTVTADRVSCGTAAWTAMRRVSQAARRDQRAQLTLRRTDAED